jgi:hypothetical protein
VDKDDDEVFLDWGVKINEVDEAVLKDAWSVTWFVLR